MLGSVTLASADEILKCDHSNELINVIQQYFPVVSVYYAVQGGCNF